MRLLLLFLSASPSCPICPPPSSSPIFPGPIFYSLASRLGPLSPESHLRASSPTRPTFVSRLALPSPSHPPHANLPPPLPLPHAFLPASHLPLIAGACLSAIPPPPEHVSPRPPPLFAPAPALCIILLRSPISLRPSPLSPSPRRPFLCTTPSPSLGLRPPSLPPPPPAYFSLPLISRVSFSLLSQSPFLALL
jgi:hypothetical protein